MEWNMWAVDNIVECLFLMTIFFIVSPSQMEKCCFLPRGEGQERLSIFPRHETRKLLGEPTGILISVSLQWWTESVSRLIFLLFLLDDSSVSCNWLDHIFNLPLTEETANKKNGIEVRDGRSGAVWKRKPTPICPTVLIKIHFPSNGALMRN